MITFIEQIYHSDKDYKGIIFLDRDGTINKESHYLQSKDQIEILPSVAEGIRLLNHNNIASIVITNQPVIAHGLITIEELKDINNTLVTMLHDENVSLDAVYSCPHHPQGNVLGFSVSCSCRKPGTAMHKAAMEKYNNIPVLGIIGDQTRDIQPAKTLMAPSVLVKTGYAGSDKKYAVTPNFVSENFLEGVKNLLPIK